jgi:LasA protease
LGYLANYYQVDLATLLTINNLSPDAVLSIGQEVQIPISISTVSPSFKIIPDSELVYGPAVAGFNVREFSEAYGGYLLQYRDQVEGRTLAGPEVVELVALRYSVNPRLLLAALEYRTGWVTRPEPPTQSEYMMGFARAGHEGLYQQLSWAANQLNWGYYGRQEGGLNAFSLADGTRVGFAPTINHGTAGVQKWLSAHDTATLATWQTESQASGFYGTYDRLFGSPFAFAIEPLLPLNLSQPTFALPWPVGEIWYFTGGPHGGWASGSAWASLDFAPDKEQLGCYLSPSWTTAVAPGLVVFSDMGGVLLDHDSDGNPGTGWVTVYWHVDRAERVPVGTQLNTGDNIGCESTSLRRWRL